MSFCIQGDALYAAESVMELCHKNGWEYIFTQKDTRQKNHYLLVQVADIIMKLYLAWNPLVKGIRQNIKKCLRRYFAKIDPKN